MTHRGSVCAALVSRKAHLHMTHRGSVCATLASRRVEVIISQTVGFVLLKGSGKMMLKIRSGIGADFGF